MKRPIGIVMIVVGLFLLAGGGFNWEWFWTRRRSQIWVDLLGRTGARVAYAVIGLALVVLGALITAGEIAL